MADDNGSQRASERPRSHGLLALTDFIFKNVAKGGAILVPYPSPALRCRWSLLAGDRPLRPGLSGLHRKPGTRSQSISERFDLYVARDRVTFSARRYPSSPCRSECGIAVF